MTTTETIVPTVGMPATYTIWTDREPCTVVEVLRNGSLIVLQQDKAVRVDTNGMSDSQDYKYERDPSGETYRFTKRVRKDGSVVWKLVGHKTKEAGGYAQLGFRRKYHDYSF